MSEQNQKPKAIDPESTHLLKEVACGRPLTTCCWDPQGRYLLFGAEDFDLHRYDLQADTVQPLSHHDSWVRAIACTPDGSSVISGGYDGRLVWWPLSDQEPKHERSVDAHTGWIRAVVISPDAQTVATCGNDRLVKLWDVATGELKSSLSGHEHHVYNIGFHPTGSFLYSCDLHGHIMQWDLAPDSEGRGEELLRAEGLHIYDKSFRADIGGARTMVVHPEGDLLALGGITKVTNAFAGVGHAVMILVNLRTGEVQQTCIPQSPPNGSTWGTAYHPDGFWITAVGGSGGGWFYFWNGREEHEFFKLKLKSEARAMAMSPDGRSLAVGHADRHLRMYALYEESGK